MTTVSSDTIDTKDLGTGPPTESTLQNQSTQLADQTSVDSGLPQDSNDEVGEKVGEEEEEGECGFCLYMKGGGCKDTFIAWEKCVEEERENGDIAEKCFEVTSALRKCMEAHADYYEPIFRAEKAAEEVAIEQMEQEGSTTKVESVEKQEGSTKAESVEKEAAIEQSPKAPSEEKH